MHETQEALIQAPNQGFIAYSTVFRLRCSICESRGPRYVKNDKNWKIYLPSKNGI